MRAGRLIANAAAAVAVAAGVVAPAGLSAESPGRPNIVVVLFDDLGWGQPPSYGHGSALRTPRFDRLAAEGMRFTDAHSASAVCTPTRYGLLTGGYPLRIGQFGVLTTYSEPLIRPGQPNLASVLKGQGYDTACIGKWHLGMRWEGGEPGSEKSVPVGSVVAEGPNQIGFDYFCGFTHARNIGTVIEQGRVVANVSPVENQPLMAEKADAWLRGRSGDRPFLLYLALCPPHTPVVPAPEFAGQSGARDTVKRDPAYGDWVFQGDAMLGAVLDALDECGFAGDTLVVATSDNGAEGRAYPPWRGSKRSVYEGGHRVPFVARWPGVVEPGSVCDATVCLNDLFATAAEVSGAEGVPPVDSASLVPLLRGDGKFARGSTVHQSHRGDLAVRRGRWKAVFHRDGRDELFDLRADPGEQVDRWADEPSVGGQLRTVLDELRGDAAE